MKKICLFLSILTVFFACSDDDYNIPKDSNGNAIITEISSATTTGISSLDNQFTVTAYFPNAKSGDVMDVECLQLQSYNNSNQLLPLSGSQKTVTVGSDLRASVSYSRSEANLKNVGDYVTVTFGGETDYALQRVEMTAATTVSTPKVSDVEVSVARNDETAYFNVTVEPKSGDYTGQLVVKRKNGVNDSYVDVEGSPFTGSQPFLVPIKGTDFAAGKDTMYYVFTTSQNGYSDIIEQTVVVIDPYFFFKRSATLIQGGSKAGLDPLANKMLAATDAAAMIALSSDLKLVGGTAWLSAGNTIEFVASTAAMYSANNSNDAIAAFAAGTKLTTADPASGEGVYIFKITTSDNEYYGMIQVTSVVPNISVSIEYRIGNTYQHLTIME